MSKESHSSYSGQLPILEIGVRSFEVAGSWPIAGGTQKLVRAIYNDSGAELRLTTSVAAIDDQGEQVVITTQSGEKIVTKSPRCCSIKCFI